MTKEAKRSTSGNGVRSAKTHGHDRIRERNRAAILASAQALFIERGYETVSVRDVTTNAGVALGTFYNHFSDKESLFRFLIDKHVEEALPRQRAIRRAARTFPEWLENYFRNLFDEVMTDPTTYALFRRNAAVIRHVTESAAHMASARALSEDIAAAIDIGLLAPVDLELITMTIIGISVELSAVVARRGGDNVDDVVQFATRLMLSGVQWRRSEPSQNA